MLNPSFDPGCKLAAKRSQRLKRYVVKLIVVISNQICYFQLGRLNGWLISLSLRLVWGGVAGVGEHICTGFVEGKCYIAGIGKSRVAGCCLYGWNECGTVTVVEYRKKGKGRKGGNLIFQYHYLIKLFFLGNNPILWGSMSLLVWNLAVAK